MASTSHGFGDTSRADVPRTIALVVAIVFLLVGIAGFIPGLTTHYGDLKFAGHMSDAKLLGVFEVSVLHNIVHLLFGVAGILLARAGRPAEYLIGGGIVYFVVWLYGVLVDHESSANFVPLNTADNWLHLILAVGMVALGLYARRWYRGPAATPGGRTI